jgi:hypothetical protein
VLGRIGLGFLLIGSFGPILAAVFPMDPVPPPGEPLVTSAGGMVHNIASVIGDGMLIGATLLTIALVRRNALWASTRPVAVLTLVLYWLGSIVFTSSVAVMMSVNGGLPGPADAQAALVGLTGRFFAVSSAVWLITAASTTLRARIHATPSLLTQELVLAGKVGSRMSWPE